jgi:hypothetical protein
MWVTKSLDRAKRRLRGPDDADRAVTPDSATSDDVRVALTRPELERFVSALAAYLDPHMPRPDSPARLAGALTTAIDRLGGSGRPSVTRSPAGLYTPEYWHVRIEGADDATRKAIAGLANGRLG